MALIMHLGEIGAKSGIYVEIHIVAVQGIFAISKVDLLVSYGFII